MANLNNIIVILVLTELESIEYTTSVSIIVYEDFIFKMVLELLDNKGDTNRDIQSLWVSLSITKYKCLLISLSTSAPHYL